MEVDDFELLSHRIRIHFVGSLNDAEELVPLQLSEVALLLNMGPYHWDFGVLLFNQFLQCSGLLLLLKLLEGRHLMNLRHFSYYIVLFIMSISLFIIVHHCLYQIYPHPMTRLMIISSSDLLFGEDMLSLILVLCSCDPLPF